MADSLDKVREGINRIDDEIADLLCRRAEFAREVRRVKQGSKISTYVPNREKEIIQRVLPKCLEAGFSREHIEGVFLSVISSCRAIVGDLEVCFAGMPGSLSHAAAVQQFGPIKNFSSVKDSSELLDRLDQGLSQFGLLPISRSDTGVSMSAVESLIKRELSVVAEREVKEELSLYSSCRELSDVCEVYGEGHSLEQIRAYVQEVCPHVNLKVLPREVLSVEGIHKELSKQGSALLAARDFSAVLNIPVLVEKVPLTDAGSVRYFVVGKEPCPLGSNAITAIICAFRDSKGALRKVLEPFSENGHNLLTLESKKSGSAPWECTFFLEVEGGVHEESLQKALSELEGICTFVKTLGSFPRFENK